MKSIDKKKTKMTKQEKNGKSAPQERRVVGKILLFPIFRKLFSKVSTHI
jgi:hypothetical protein